MVLISLLHNGMATNCCWATSPFYGGGFLFVVGLLSASADRLSRLKEGICQCLGMRSVQKEHSQGSLQHLAGPGSPQGWHCVTVHLSW